jgi:hypothetical protein
VWKYYRALAVLDQVGVITPKSHNNKNNNNNKITKRKTDTVLTRLCVRKKWGRSVECSQGH